jgi:CBS domain-containing protein
MVQSDTAMQQLYHFKEVGGTNYATFDTGALLLFFIPYFLLASVTSGTFCPAGLFVPTLLSGAAFGRIIGHILNCIAPGYVTDSGTYALIGAAAVLGGMSRMTIAGTIIILEACGNPAYLLPLMLTFAAARYTGNAINEPMYDMQIHLKELPFLEGSLKTLGLLNYHPIAELMSHPVVTLNEINKVSDVYDILSSKTHNGFPVVGKNGHLKGFILRKTLCNVIKLGAFSAPKNSTLFNENYNLHSPSAENINHGGLKLLSVNDKRQDSENFGDGSFSITPIKGVNHENYDNNNNNGNFNNENINNINSNNAIVNGVELAPVAAVFHDTLERNYPHYARIEEISLTESQMVFYLYIYSSIYYLCEVYIFYSNLFAFRF